MQFSVATPEEMGVASESISRTLDYLSERRVPLHSLLIMRHNALICEGYAAPYTEKTLHHMYSETKSLVSLAIGIMCAKGYLNLTDKIVDHFAEEIPFGGPSPELARLTIRDMLKMETPYNGTTYKRRPTKDWVGSFFRARADHNPGSLFYYDTSSTHVLCALVEKYTHKSMLDMLRQEVLDKIGFSADSYCLKDPKGVSQGGSGLMATPRDMMALLYLIAQGGIWDGQQLLPREYLQEATSFQVDTTENGGRNGWDFAQGYGYQFWRLTHNAWCMYGMGGQFSICLPEKDMLIVTTADTQGLLGGEQTMLDALWNCLLPGVCETPLAPNASAYAALNRRLTAMALPCVANLAEAGGRNCTAEAQMQPNAPGLTQVRLRLDALELCYGEKSCTLRFQAGGLAQGYLWDDPTIPYTAAAGWRAPDTLLLRVYLLGERLGNFSVQLHLTEAGVTLALTDHEEYQDSCFSGEAQGMR